ncbi:hypothetical protein [Streptomyces hyaluromycini]|uniref:hypothetical protein n=1 Tax=Streptomyces hyaluromycini TaxID=1377993 RepID=UPI000B5CDED6|nr:hypothetical protein [Streptomyces hyaluromycini]
MPFSLLRPPKRHVGRRRLAAVSVGLACALLTTLPAAADAGAGTGTAAASSTATGVGTDTTTVTLVTGDRIVVTTRPGRKPTYVALPAAGEDGAVESYDDASGDHYAIPAVAMPYLGNGLDRSLFDITRLAQDQEGSGTAGATSDNVASAGDGGRISVDLSFAPGTTPAAPAGVTLTSVSGATARGYLTASSDTAFTAALRRAIGADVAAGRRPGSTPLSDGLTSMSLAGAPSEDTPDGTVSPKYPLKILQINATGLTGLPATAYLQLYNTDSLTRENTSVAVVDGVARVAVPAGNYGLYGLFYDYDAQGRLSAVRQFTLSDFTVSATGTTTVSLDETTASSLFSVRTPRPAVQDILMASYFRRDATGALAGMLLTMWGSTPLYTNAQPAAEVGEIHDVIQWGATAATASDAYRYDLAYGSDGVPADQTHVETARTLATVHQHFAIDPAANNSYHGSLLNGFVDSYNSAGGYTQVSPWNGQQWPADLTEYLGTGDGGTWAQMASSPGAVWQYADPVTFAGGRSYSVDWNHGPLRPALARHVGYQFCAACAAGPNLTMILDPAVDSVPTHVGFYAFVAVPQHFTLYADGQQVFDSTYQDGVELKGTPTTPTTYRTVYDTDLSADPAFSQSTRTHTDLTFRYTPQTGGGSALPDTDTCFGKSADTPCQILPALTLGYRLASDNNNTSDRPIQTMRLDVGHVSYDGAGSHSRITSAKVSVSYDGGTTWKPALVVGAHGTYQVAWLNPASAHGTSPALKVTATDAAGGSITQTITNAYTIAKPATTSSAAASGGAR